METLNDIQPGQSVIVCKLENEESMKKRLQDIGIICGTKVKCVQESPLGDPKAFLIRGAVVAIRKKDLIKIKVESIT